jgi:hypothetical protein
MPESPFFIVGCPRSGTTLLRWLLCAHPRLTVPGESHFIPHFWRAYGDPANAEAATKLAARVLGLERIARWDTGLKPRDFADVRSYRDFLHRLFAPILERENRVRWGDKTPHYVQEIPTLAGLFPDARFIHIYRDGRDVALSWLAARMEPGNVYKAASLWNGWVRQGRADGARLSPGQYMEVRYETLIENPEQIMPEVCRFLGEEFDAAVLRPKAGNMKAGRVRQPIFGARSAAFVSKTEIVPGNHDKWREQMQPRDRVLFESVAGGLLDDLGYETEGRRRAISVAERAWWELHHLGNWSFERLNTRQSPKMLTAFVKTKWASLIGRARPHRPTDVR